MFAAMGGVELFFLFALVVFLVPTIWAVVDMIQRPPEQYPRFVKAGSSDKTGWVIALVVGWFIGLGWLVAIVYLILVRKRMGPVTEGSSAAPPGAPPSVPG